MRRLLLVLALTATGCGTAATEAASAGDITDAQRHGARNALELLRGRYPALRVDETAAGVRLTIRRTGEAPVVVVDGTVAQSGYGEAAGILAEEVVAIEVLTSMADTLVYGAEAARRGVVRITTRLSRE